VNPGWGQVQYWAVFDLSRWVALLQQIEDDDDHEDDRLKRLI
jgi:hypothetical protein